MSIPPLMQDIVVTLLGSDRPGLVESIATHVRNLGGNWTDSRLCRLGGQFAGILRISLPADRLTEWDTAVASLRERGMEINQTRNDSTPTTPGRTARFELLGQDQPGIIQRIASVWAAHHINVEEMTTLCRPAPWTGENLFEATATVTIPDTCDTHVVQQDLEAIASDLMVDINFQ